MNNLLIFRDELLKLEQELITTDIQSRINDLKSNDRARINQSVELLQKYLVLIETNLIEQIYYEKVKYLIDLFAFSWEYMNIIGNSVGRMSQKGLIHSDSIISDLLLLFEKGDWAYKQLNARQLLLQVEKRSIEPDSVLLVFSKEWLLWGIVELLPFMTKETRNNLAVMANTNNLLTRHKRHLLRNVLKDFEKSIHSN